MDMESLNFLKLIEIDGKLFLKVSGHYLNADETQFIIAGLTSGLDVLKVMHPQQFRMQHAVKVAEEIAASASVVWPKSKSDIRSSGPCVYFIAKGGQIKIGSTQNLSNRFNAHSHLYGEDIRIIGFLKTPDYQELEFGLLAKFDHLHQGGEWFTPVDEILSWLDGLRGNK
jgi:hypothetical protein